MVVQSIHEHIDHVLFEIMCLFALFYACRFCIHVERKMRMLSLGDEIANYVVLVFVLHDVLWNRSFDWWTGLRKDDELCYLKVVGFCKMRKIAKYMIELCW
jgi:hypothetical protein